MDYYKLLEQLLVAMTDLNGLNLPAINTALEGLCKELRISKGVTEFYDSVQHEKAGKGERFVCYDSGEPSHEVMHRRIVTDAMTVAICSVYMADGAAPLSEEESFRVDLIQKTVLSFVSRNRLQHIVERLTFYDDAGYRNLRYFFRNIERLKGEGKLTGQAAVHLNLKHFSLVNQQVGRNAGNLVMKKYVSLLEEAAGEGGLVVRVGGDNFAMLFSAQRLDKVIKCLSGEKVVYDVNTGYKTMVSACAGIFLITDDFLTKEPGQIMDKIISASQAARRSGDTDIIFFNESMEEDREKVARLQRIFPDSLKNNEFQVYYQPKINIDDGELAGAEALCRWWHDGKLIPPGDFIPLLEQSSDICKLDFYMLDKVCRDIRRWLDEGRPVVRISVNLSRKHMVDLDLLNHIIEIIDRHNVPHKYLEIELTETTTDVEFRDLKRVVSGLQDLGIYTSVDDFGMGYSSLNLIREIPWNVLKVDKSFLPVEEDSENSTRSIMFKYVVAMAKALGLECIAEGVETSRQVDVLRHNECELAQGFYFDRPLPVDDFEDRLKVHKYPVPEFVS